MSERIKPFPGMKIDRSIEFEPGIYTFEGGAGLEILASDITISGNGAVLVGPGVPGEKESFAGTAVSSTGNSGVTLQGVTVHGFQLALSVIDGAGWQIRNNDFSGNFSDDTYGWGEGYPYGAVMLTEVRDSIIEGNTAISNWNGLYLRRSSNNQIRHNQFSHCTNVCLKLWESCNNDIADNIFSHGIRIAPGETHARDSTSALLESGSNHNRFYRNDFTFGGDGVFIRPLNGWQSTGNYFEENDASYAHNNAWECWSPGNIFVRNKANYSSYGFWLGGSDYTTLVENEAAYNGVLHCNAPEKDFGHAGVAVVHGSSSHFVMKGNLVHHNNGAGLAVGFRDDYPALHWVIAGNVLTANRDGIYYRNASALVLRDNQLTDNENLPIREGDGVSNMLELCGPAPEVWRPENERFTLNVLDAARSVSEHAFAVPLGQHVTIEAAVPRDWNANHTHCFWFFDGAKSVETRSYTIHCEQPGFYRISATAWDDKHIDLDWIDLYVVDESSPEAGTEDLSAKWALMRAGTERTSSEEGEVTLAAWDPATKLVGQRSLRVTSTRDAFVLRLSYEGDLSKAAHLQFWVRVRHQAVFGLSGTRQRVRIGRSDNEYTEYDRGGHLFEALRESEAWMTWRFVSIPLAGDETWNAATVGASSLAEVRYVDFVFDRASGEDAEKAAYDIWIDGLQFV